MPLSEFPEYGFAVVTDGRQLDPLLLEPLFCRLQLDQLRFAERSPIGRAKEQQNRTVCSLQGFIGLFLILLIAEPERGNFASNFEADG